MPESNQSPSDIRAFCFDVFGTVVDWREGIVRDARVFLARLGRADIDPHVFADAWRARYQPAMAACREGRRPYTRLDILHRENLLDVFTQFDIDASIVPEHEHDWLNMSWHRLDPWPDVVEGLTRLKTRYVIAPASNGNIALMVDLAKRAGLPWDAILGADVSRQYKPNPDSYLALADVLALRPEQVCMTAAHNDDLAAARACGLRTAFVPRPGEHGNLQRTDLEAEQDWDIVATDFIDLARQAGC